MMEEVEGVESVERVERLSWRDRRAG